ncbi:MAG: VWA domain-containing protein [Ardenticatenaceae bacterium]|nr:VWA domain-containing protein [Ardenticatenaceae bacterium]
MRRLLVFISLFALLFLTGNWVNAEHAGNQWQTETRQQNPDDQPRPLEIVLLNDSSASTADSDPDGLRIRAATYLLDYILGAGDTVGLNHRFAVTNFNTDVFDERTLSLLSDNAIRDGLTEISTGWTDFVPPFRFALNELRNSFGSDRNMVVVLFTDGRPELPDASGQPQDIDQDQYFDTLSTTLNELQTAGVNIFVVALGDTDEDRRLWTAPGRIPASNYRSIDSTTDLADVYHSFLADLLGLQPTDYQGMASGETFSATLPPYLEQVIFSLVKDDPSVVTRLREPSGAIVPPSQGSPDDLHEIYVISTPRPGWWQLEVNGGGAQLWVDQRLPLFTLRTPLQPVALQSDLDIEGELLRLGQPVIDNSLEVQLTVVLPTGQTEQRDMRLGSNGTYIANLADLLTESGNYVITAQTQLSGSELNVRTAPTNISAFPVPQMQFIDIDGERTVSQPITVTTQIANAQVLAPETTIPVYVRVSGGELVGSIDLRDDGISPDEVTEDGVFTANSSFPTVPGEYIVELRLEGVTQDGVPFNLRPQVTNIQIDRTLLVPGPIVSVTPIPKPMVTPNPTPANTTASIDSAPAVRQRGIVNFGWLLFSGMAAFVAASGAWTFHDRLVKERNRFQEEEEKWHRDKENWEREQSNRQIEWKEEKENFQEKIDGLKEQLEGPKRVQDQLREARIKAERGRWGEAKQIVGLLVESITTSRQAKIEEFIGQYEDVASEWLQLLDKAENGELKKGIRSREDICKWRDDFVVSLAADNNREATVALMRALQEYYWKYNGSLALSYLYDTVFARGGNVQLILDVIAQEKIPPLHQLSRCILTAQKDPTPDNLLYVADAARELLDEPRSGMVKLYELLSHLAKSSPASMSLTQEDFNHVKKLLEDDGLTSLVSIVEAASKLLGEYQDG